jgi:hypothetical protein
MLLRDSFFCQHVYSTAGRGGQTTDMRESRPQPSAKARLAAIAFAKTSQNMSIQVRTAKSFHEKAG